MAVVKIYLAECDGDVLPFLYLRDIMRHYGLPGLYNIRPGDEFSYKGVNIKRYYLQTK